METLKEMLLKEQKRMERIAEKTKVRLKDAPQGTLRLSSCRKIFSIITDWMEKKETVHISQKNKWAGSAIWRKNHMMRRSYDQQGGVWLRLAS